MVFWRRAVEGVVMFGGAFAGRRVLVTGHTGFKGSWLCAWLTRLGAEVHGLALDPETSPSLNEVLGLDLKGDARVDIRDAERLAGVMSEVRPEVVLHLAAQPLVRRGYSEPGLTWETNVQGTVNLLEAVRSCDSVRSCVVVTSDKCYENREWEWGYRETDCMGGHDPYSASKGACELVVASYRRSFFSGDATCRLASARAGNVIGGGDWASDRIVTDFIKSCVAGADLELRNPMAVRPWQHVLEPLSGYLLLAARMLDPEARGAVADGWNFGPTDSSITTVRELASRLVKAWGSGRIVEGQAGTHPHEAAVLKLDAGKAAMRLRWRGVWDVPRTIEQTVAWYRAHYEGNLDMKNFTSRQIDEYVNDASEGGLAWVQ